MMKNIGFLGSFRGIIRGTFQSRKKSHELGFISLFYSILHIAILGLKKQFCGINLLKF
jgi:hypothetical protein